MRMNKMKRLLLVLLASVMPALLMADDYLNVEKSDASIESIKLEEVRKITFSEDNLLIHTTENILSFPIAEMGRITFTDTPTSVDELADSSPSMMTVNNKLVVKGEGTLFVYNLAGNLVNVAVVKGAAEISTHSLPAGTYIVRFGKETIKVVKL